MKIEDSADLEAANANLPAVDPIETETVGGSTIVAGTAEPALNGSKPLQTADSSATVDARLSTKTEAAVVGAAATAVGSAVGDGIDVAVEELVSSQDSSTVSDNEGSRGTADVQEPDDLDDHDEYAAAVRRFGTAVVLALLSLAFIVWLLIRK